MRVCLFVVSPRQLFKKPGLQSAMLRAGIAEGTPVAPMADSQAWPQPATQVPLDAMDDAEQDVPYQDGGEGFQDDSDGDNGYQAGVPLLCLATHALRYCPAATSPCSALQMAFSQDSTPILHAWRVPELGRTLLQHRAAPQYACMCTA